MDSDFTIDEPFIDNEGNSLWIVDYEEEGIFLFVTSPEGCEIRVDLNRISARMLAERIAA